MKFIINLTIAILITQSVSASPNISSMSIGEIDSLDFSSWNISDIENTTDQAIILINDTLKENQRKGRVLLGVIADYIQKSILHGTLEENEARYILEKLESQQYFITLPSPSDFEKLVCYLCEGRYQYIYKRASHVKGFFPIAILTALLLSVFMFRAYKWIKNWSHKKRFTVALMIISLFFLVKITCCNYV